MPPCTPFETRECLILQQREKLCFVHSSQLGERDHCAKWPLTTCPHQRVVDPQLRTEKAKSSNLFIPTIMSKVRPAARLMEASAQCSQLGAAYGDCVYKSYNNIAKDACQKEFLMFKECVSSKIKRK
ncbi:hypothetical protein OXX59_007267 [Metschnikowia pulcherrima]